MIVYIWNYCSKNKLELYTILPAPIRAQEDIYVLQSGKLCRIRSQYFRFQRSKPLFQGVETILQERIKKSRGFEPYLYYLRIYEKPRQKALAGLKELGIFLALFITRRRVLPSDHIDRAVISSIELVIPHALGEVVRETIRLAGIP